MLLVCGRHDSIRWYVWNTPSFVTDAVEGPEMCRTTCAVPAGATPIDETWEPAGAEPG